MRAVTAYRAARDHPARPGCPHTRYSGAVAIRAYARVQILAEPVTGLQRPTRALFVWRAAAKERQESTGNRGVKFAPRPETDKGKSGDRTAAAVGMSRATLEKAQAVSKPSV